MASFLQWSLELQGGVSVLTTQVFSKGSRCAYLLGIYYSTAPNKRAHQRGGHHLLPGFMCVEGNRTTPGVDSAPRPQIQMLLGSQHLPYNSTYFYFEFILLKLGGDYCLRLWSRVEDGRGRMQDWLASPMKIPAESQCVSSTLQS